MQNTKRQEMTLIFVGFLMGTTFFFIQAALRYVDALFLVGVRFFMAALLLLFSYKKKDFADFNRRDFYPAALIGLTFCLACLTQTIGLNTISVSKSAFITTLYVPLVPFLQWFFTKETPSLGMWFAIFISFAGLILITGYQNILSLHLGIGELVTFGCAFFSALTITLMSHFSRHANNHKNFAFTQLVIGALFCFICMPLGGETLPSFSWMWFLPIFFLAATSSLIQFLASWAQKSLTSSKATLIYATEPVWASLMSWCLGSPPTPHVLIGGALIIIGIAVGSLSRRHQ